MLPFFLALLLLLSLLSLSASFSCSLSFEDSFFFFLCWPFLFLFVVFILCLFFFSRRARFRSERTTIPHARTSPQRNGRAGTHAIYDASLAWRPMGMPEIPQKKAVRGWGVFSSS